MIDVRDFSVAVQANLGFRQTLELLKEGLRAQGFQIVSEVTFGTEALRSICLVVWGPVSAYQSVVSDPEARIFMPFSITVAPSPSGTVVAVTNPAMYSRIWARMLARELVRAIHQVLVLVEMPIATGELVPMLAQSQAATAMPNCEILTWLRPEED
jgi:uncharacterized protein (DUF302 family)